MTNDIWSSDSFVSNYLYRCGWESFDRDLLICNTESNSISTSVGGTGQWSYCPAPSPYVLWYSCIPVPVIIIRSDCSNYLIVWVFFQCSVWPLPYVGPYAERISHPVSLPCKAKCLIRYPLKLYKTYKAIKTH